MTVLVTGGAGYIGSHMAYALLDQGEAVVILDNLSTGVRRLVPDQAVFITGDIGDASLVMSVLRDHRIDTIVHFAGSTIVPESVANPLLYYANNTRNSHSLIKAAVSADVKRFIFSSTAAVYGSGDGSRLLEDAPKSPVNPYGRSKLMTEWMLQDTAHSHDFRYMALRYFNVCGADPLGRTGQSTACATHLIKRACQVALGRIPHLDIFGTDFDTADGTGVRDYIHVSDLVNVHLLALRALRGGSESSVYNVGYGRGFSVREVIAAAEHVARRKIRVVERGRRIGDPAFVVANSDRVKSALSWDPHYDDLVEIVRSAYEWEQKWAVCSSV